VLDILCVTYFLTSITMPNPQTRYVSDMVNNDQRFLWHQLALASSEFYV